MLPHFDERIRRLIHTAKACALQSLATCQRLESSLHEHERVGQSLTDKSLPEVCPHSDLITKFETLQCDQHIPRHVDQAPSKHVSEWRASKVVFETVVNSEVSCAVLDRHPRLSHVQWLQNYINRRSEKEVCQ